MFAKTVLEPGPKDGLCACACRFWNMNENKWFVRVVLTHSIEFVSGLIGIGIGIGNMNLI